MIQSLSLAHLVGFSVVLKSSPMFEVLMSAKQLEIIFP